MSTKETLPTMNADKSVEWLKKQCNRHKNGYCNTAACLRRGGYVKGMKFEFEKSVATCEAHEAITLIEAQQREIKRIHTEHLRRVIEATLTLEEELTQAIDAAIAKGTK